MTNNNQKTFDLMINHLQKQGKKAMNVNSKKKKLKYTYHTNNNSKYTIKILIPNSNYLPSFEGHRAHYTPIYDILKKNGHFFGMCFDIQIMHDGVDLENWEEEFEKIAKMYNLTYTPVQKEE